MISAGRVLLMPKGAYDPSTTYEMLDIVSYNGSSYIAKDTTTGNLPTDTTYWQLSAYGGQAANIAGNFAELEISSVASTTHYADDIFVDENSQLMKATQTINIGDTIDVNTNCTPTTVEALITSLSDRVDSLDSTNRKLQGAIEIAAQTDLHSLALGEYYKKQTSFYVTNAPTGIDQDPTAVFRLTIEAALDNASQASSPLLLTLRTPDGKIFTQGYDGTTWKSWEEIANENSVATKQNIIDNTLQTTSKTVPGAINELNSKNQTLTNEVDTIVNELGAKNLLLPTSISSGTSGGITYTVNSNGSITFNNQTSTSAVGLRFNGGKKPLTYYGLKAGETYIMSGGVNSNLSLQIQFRNSNENVISQPIDNGDGKEFTIPSDAYYCDPFIFIPSGVTVNGTVYPMIRPADIEDSTFVPYAMTNRELTENTSLTYDATIATELKLHRVGKMVDVTNAGNVTVSDLLAATVPAEFRPRIETPLFCYVVNGANRYMGRVSFAKNGAISAVYQMNNDGTVTTLTGSEKIQVHGTWLL